MPAHHSVTSRACHWISLSLPPLVILILWLLFFWPMITGQEIAGYRDSSYLYYPMFQWIDREIAAGNFPLWMPFDDSGFPLLADGTSSMLYPGKLIFLLRSLCFPARYGIYLAMHVLLAAAGTFWLARTLRADRLGACVAAISFAFGGSLLFQVCNVVYLVSGAWLPTALTCVWKMLQCDQQKPARWSIAAGVSCGMMILGGDPQMVYHVGLIALATIVFIAIANTGEAFWKNCRSLIVMVIVTSGVAAAQLIPTIGWAQHSDRVSVAQPLNVWQAIGSQKPIANLKALAATTSGPPQSDIYQFSQEPWTVIEFLWSGIFGSDAPVNTRWTAAFPGAERLWMPSIYFGVIPFVLALSGMRFWNSRSGKRRKGRAGQMWLSWIAVWFLIASFGWYGPVWLARELSLPVDRELFEGSFGVYWLMVTALPKYALFRYPAKLVVIAALAMCVLAGMQTRHSTIVKCSRSWCGLTVVSLVAALVMLTPFAFEQLKQCNSTGLYGPFQTLECQWAMVFSLFKTMLFSGAVWVICFLVKKSSGRNCRSRFSDRFGMPPMSVVPVTVVVLIAGDLMISNRWMLHPVSAPGIAEPSLIAQKIQNDRAAADLDPRELLSIDRSDGRVDFDPLWLETSSPDRIAEIARWRRESLFPKTHLDISNVQVHGSFCSIMPAAMNRSASSNDEADLLEIARTADGYVTATGSGPVLAWNEGALPMAWIENASASSDSYDRDTVFCNCLWSDGKFEIHLPETSVKEKAASDLRLVVRLLTTDGWSANLLDDHGQVQSSLELMRIDDFHACVSVPQIHRRVQLIYRPVSFRVGLGISAVSIVAILGFLLLDFRAPKLPKASKAR